MLEQLVRGPLLIPNDDGSVTFHPDGVLAADGAGILQFAGPYASLRDTGLWPVQGVVEYQPTHNDDELSTDQEPVSQKKPRRFSEGIMLPPLLDIHTHVPQHPIRGRFVDGVPADASDGRLLAGLKRNVFPAEAKCATADYAEQVVRQFLADTLSHGVVGGAAYMTPSTTATEIVLSILPASWSVGLVMMNQNCPEDLRTDETNFEADMRRLATRFGRRLIVTDRFAVAVNSPLRRRGSSLARELDLSTQTHLNEQRAEKQLVEGTLYPNSASYTDVYLQDGLLDHHCIAAHCIHMTGDEWSILRDTGSRIAHCPTSNLLLGSGCMPLDEVRRRGIPYAIATDVGASPTVSMLAEMKRFTQVHVATSAYATGCEALNRATLAPADLLGLGSQLGRLRPGMPMSFIEGESSLPPAKMQTATAESVVQSLLPTNPDQPAATVNRVTLAGKVVFQRSGTHA